MAADGLLGLFDRTFVINLPHRLDRRRHIQAQLGRPGVDASPSLLASRVEFVQAIRPTEADSFRSIGAKGCFLSHLSVLKAAATSALDSVLVLEDDAEFGNDTLLAVASLEAALSHHEWGVVQLGHQGGPPAPVGPAGWNLVPFRGEVTGLHCYAVHRRAVEPLIEHFERQLVGEPGDPVYGPMDADGTVNTFSWVRKDVQRHLLVPSICRQVESRSDITTGRWDTVPGTHGFLRLVRRARRTLRTRAAAPRS